MQCLIHVDGGSRGNPGPAGTGVVLRDAATGKPMHEAGYFLGNTTNNVAEYRGLIKALQVAAQLHASTVHIHSDSQLLVRQIMGQYRVKAPQLKPLYDQARKALEQFTRWRVDYVPREENTRADELANQAMDARGDVVLSSQLPGVTPTEQAPPAAEAPTPCFTATLQGKSGTCIHGMSTGNAYTFGPTTPDGFCIHAASAVLTAGPLQWSASKRTGNVRCPRCQAGVKIDRLI